MSRYFSQMLLGNLPKTHQKGRPVTFSSAEIDINLTTGSMRERVLGYLAQVNLPSTAKDIAEGIGSDTGRVNRILQQLLSSDQVAMIKVEGAVKEYHLPAKPTATKNKTRQ